MASNYPSSADALSNPASGDALSTGHAAQHANANDAIEAIESTLGLNPQGASATVKARLDAIEADSWVTSARILDGTIVNGDVSASAAIDPSKVAQNVVTFSNADAVVATSTRKLVQIGTMSASRTVTLPAASGVPAGTELVVADLSGSVTTTNTIVVSRAGSDTVNGATSTTIGAAYGWRRFVSDGSSKWVFDGGVHRTSDTGTVTSTNILDGTIVNADISASAAIDVSKLSGVVTSAGVGNLLTVNQASVETDGTGLYGYQHCSVARTTAVALDGSASLAVTTGATVSTFFTPSTGNSAGSGVSVTAGQTYTGSAFVRSAVTPRTAQAAIYWWTAGGSFISASFGNTVTTTTTGWTRTLCAAVAPATAAKATVHVIFTCDGTVGEVHYVDCWGLWLGAGGTWALPGTPIANLGTYTDESVGRRIFTWDTVNSRWQMTYGDTGWRDVSALLANGWGGTLLVRRHNGRVSWRTGLGAASLDGTSASAVTAFTMSSIDAGFRNDTSGRRTLVYNSSDTTFTVAAIGSDALIMPAYGAGKKYNFVPEAVYTAGNAWPASLPGSASGSIPSA